MTTNPFECPVCLEVYDSIGHIPTTFLCGHSCCISHASGLDGCPICRGPIPKNVCATVSLRDGAVAYMKLLKGDLEKKALSALQPPSKLNMEGECESIDVPEATKNSIESLLPLFEGDYGVKLKICHYPGRSSKLSIQGDDADIVAIAKYSIEEIIEKELAASAKIKKPSSTTSTGVSNEQKSGFSDPFKPFDVDPFASFSSSIPLVPTKASNTSSPFPPPVSNTTHQAMRQPEAKNDNFVMDFFGGQFTSPTSQLSPATNTTANGSPFVLSNHSNSPFSPLISLPNQAPLKPTPTPAMKYTSLGAKEPKEQVYLFIDQANAIATARYLIDPQTNFIIGDPTRFIRFDVLDNIILGINRTIANKVVFPYLDQSCLTKIEATLSSPLTPTGTCIFVTATDPYSRTYQDAFFHDVMLKALYKGWTIELWTWKQYCHEKYSQLQQAYSNGLHECLTIHYLDDYSDILLSHSEGV